MASATLTASSNSQTFDTTAGTLYSLGVTGHMGGGKLLLEVALAASETVFAPLGPEPYINASTGSDYRAVGSKLRVTLLGATSSGSNGSVNVEITTAV